LALLRVVGSVGLTWPERLLRERVSTRLSLGGDLRRALSIRREGVERGVARGGYDLAFALALYGSELMAAGWAAEGVEYLGLAETVSRDWQNSLPRDITVLTLATGLGLRGRTDEAEALLATVDRARNPSDAQRTAVIYGTEAAIRWGAGQARAAADLYQAALVASLQSRNRQLPVIVYNNLAGAQVLAGDLEEAEESLAAGESRVRPGSHLEAHLLGTRAQLELARGNPEAAGAVLERSSEIKERTGALGGRGWTLAMKARVAVAARDYEQARPLLKESAPILQAVEALRAWKAAAEASGQPAAGVGLAGAAPDDLLERARNAARPVSARTDRVQRAIPTVIGALLGLAGAWLLLGLLGRLLYALR
jgi:ATP/maltotriose-dependent transcriptional regulator MalT